MKKIIVGATLFWVAVFSGETVAVDATGTASINVLQPLTISTIDHMDFGGSVIAPSSGVGDVYSDTHDFTIYGNSGESFAFSVDPNANCGTQTLVTLSLATDADNPTVFNEANKADVLVGGTLTVLVGAQGVYNCTFSVTANYE